VGAVYFANLKYRDRVISILKTYLDEYIQTEIQVRKDNIHLSILKKFPYASIDLYDILIKSVHGPDYSHITYIGKDTFIYAKRISLEFNIMSIFTKKYELNKIQIDNAIINILLDEKAVGNYSVFKSSSTENKNESFSIDIRKIKFAQVHLKYIDYASYINFSGLIDQASLSGILSKDDFLLKLQLESQHSSIDIQNTKYFDDQTINIKTEISKIGEIYKINNCDLDLSGLQLEARGEWGNNKKFYSISFENKGTTFQNLRHSVFNEYLSKFNYLPEKGLFKLNASVSGFYGFGNPFINSHFEISKGVFRNKFKNIDIDDFFVKGNYTNGIHRNNESSALEIDSLSAVYGKSKVYLKGKLENFNSPCISVHLRGNIELSSLSAIESVKQRFELSGNASTTLTLSGNLPTFKSFLTYDLNKLTLHGELLFKDIFIKTLINPLPSATVSGKITINNFRAINLENVIIHTGESILEVDGTVTDIPIFKTDSALVPIYRCNVKSPEVHVEDFILKQTENKKQDENTKESFPDSIIVFANINAEKIFFGKFAATEVIGNFQYQSKTLHITGLSMKSQEGTILSDINISQEAGLFIINSNATVQNADIKNLFYSFNNFGQNVIVSENLAGRLSGSVHVTAVWNQYLLPVYDRLNLQSEIEINKGEIIDYEPLMGLSKFIKVDELKHIYFDQLHTNINVQQETVYVSQTDIHSSAISLTGSGEHHFDNSYIYRIQVQLSDVLWNKAKKKKPENTEFGYEVDDGLGRTSLPLKIKGHGTNFEVGYDLHTAGNLFFDKFKKEKKEVHNLFMTKDTSFNQPQNTQENNEPRIEWKDEKDEGSNQKKEKKTNSKDDYSIEWKDD